MKIYVMPSPVEKIKDDSRGIRGNIEPTLASDATHFSEDDYQLLKFHGTYQQDDRDLRVKRKQEGLDKAWSFMVRTKCPGGDITAERYLVLDRLADEVANGTMRITTRQGIQFHGVLMKSLRQCIASVNKAGITTWGACGDVVRNTLATSTPLRDAAHDDVQRLGKEISDTFLPHASSYQEIWVNGKKLESNAALEDEPIYGKHYLPRKFKIALAVPPQNDVDIYSNDLGFVCHAPNGKVEGYTILVGGGFGMTHGLLKTYPVLALPLFYVKREHALAAAIAIVQTQRDNGNRDDRKLSRLKYVIEQKGIEWFRAEVVSRLKAPTETVKPFQFTTVADRLGWHEQGDGKLFCGVWVSQGRIKDADKIRYRTGFRTIVQRIGCPVRLTANCNILFYNIEPSKRGEVDQILKEHDIPHSDGFTEARKTSHACVALPTCGLALAESERVFSSVMDGIDAILRELRLEKEPILIRMSGCPNGCPRPYNADIAFVGRGPKKYAVFLGGSIVGDRLVGLEHKSVEEKNLPKAVRPYLEEFAAKRKSGETFSAFWGRTHVTGPRPVPEQFHVELAERAAKLVGAKLEPVG